MPNSQKNSPYASLESSLEYLRPYCKPRYVDEIYLLLWEIGSNILKHSLHNLYAKCAFITEKSHTLAIGAMEAMEDYAPKNCMCVDSTHIDSVDCVPKADCVDLWIIAHKVESTQPHLSLRLYYHTTITAYSTQQTPTPHATTQYLTATPRFLYTNPPLLRTISLYTLSKMDSTLTSILDSTHHTHSRHTPTHYTHAHSSTLQCPPNPTNPHHNGLGHRLICHYGRIFCYNSPTLCVLNAKVRILSLTIKGDYLVL